MPENRFPKLSVILPVYNGLPYLAGALDSVLCQSFDDFELIVVNDGSTDGSDEVIKKLDDPRIRYLQQSNKGLAAALNRAITVARGTYIARQDQDDVSFPFRFQEQVAFLDSNPDAGMVGTSAAIWIGDTPTGRIHRHPLDDASIRFSLLFDNYFVHSSVMIRKSVLEEVGGYSEDKSRQPPEDYELWSRIMRIHKVCNLPDILLAYREVPTSMSRTGNNPFLQNVVKISAENIAWASDTLVDAPEVTALSKLFHRDYDGMPRGVKFSTMRSVLDKAIARIARESNVIPRSMDSTTRGTIQKLRYRYFDYRSGGLIGKALDGNIGHFAKSMAIRLMQKENR